MTKTAQDFFGSFDKMFGDYPVNVNEVTKNVAEYNAKLGKIALEAARKNAEQSQAWATDTLNKMEVFTKVQSEPSDYAKVVSDFVSGQFQAAPEQVAAFAEIAKQAQSKTVEVMLAAGKDIQAEAAEIAKSATKKAA